MKVIVCGGRKFHDYDALERYLDMLHALHRFTLVIHGDARGADSLAKYWANQRHIESHAYPADWDTFKRSAGPIRNKKMLDQGQPNLVVAFPGGEGTKDMMKQARTAGVPVLDLRDTKVRADIRQRYGDRGGRCGGADTPP
jgi:hypothetical protein